MLLRSTVCLSAVLVGLTSLIGDQPPSESTPLVDNDAVAFINSYCVDCHNAADPEAGLDLESTDLASGIGGSIDHWNRVADIVSSARMPPPDAELPDLQSRNAFVESVRRSVHHAACAGSVAPGPPVVRRLNRTEYANTIRDLLGIHVNAAHALPVDGAGGEGFDNAAETLFISPIHAEKYLDAARSALGHALKDPRSRDQIIIARPDDQRSPREAAVEVLTVFLPKAFRRPATDEEVGQYVQLFNAAYRDQPSFSSAIRFALQAALVSPKFLFICESPPPGDDGELISQYEMASRLSYFLWASMPDEELMRLAADGRLHDESVLNAQVKRMLRSDIRNGLRRGAKVRALATSFVEQWLGTRALGREFKPDPSVGPYDSELEGGMQYEPIFFFEDLLADNRSLLNLIDSDFTYLNNRLARHYRIEGRFREQPRRTELPPDSRRGGVLGMGSVLAVSSYPHRTSPVLRGKWIMETLLGTPPPPPPPNVPELEQASGDGAAVSLRQRLQKHRADSACASCHAAMDPLGFGLENFGVLGDWRSEIDGVPIDSSGELPDGATFDGPDQLKQLLLDRRQQFIRHLTSKMLGYALARGLTHDDRCVVESIAAKLAADDYRAQTLVQEIVKSVPFRYKRAAAQPRRKPSARPPTKDQTDE